MKVKQTEVKQFSLQKLLLRFFGRKKRTIGFRINKELEACGGEIMKVFGVKTHIRDYEDTREWFEGETDGGLHVNVSRTHNWKNGDYEVPVTVCVSGPIPLLDNKNFFPYAQSLANILGTEIWIGEIIPSTAKRRDFRFDIHERFLPKV